MQASLAIVFGRRVRALREARNWTQEQLAKASGLGAKHVGVIERGEKTSSFEAVERIAGALDVDYHELFIRQDRHTGSIEKEISILLDDANRIDLPSVQDFLRSLRAALKKLDRKAQVHGDGR